MIIFYLTLLIFQQTIVNLEARKGAPINMKKLPYDAPNAAVAIYNKLVDNYMGRLELEVKKTADPLHFLIHGTPDGPLVVPSHLSVRPQRRPGQGLGKAFEHRLDGRISEDDEAEVESEAPGLNWRLLDLLPSFSLLSPLEHAHDPQEDFDAEAAHNQKPKADRNNSKSPPLDTDSEEESDEESALESARNTSEAASSTAFIGRKKVRDESQEDDLGIIFGSDESGEENREPLTNAVMTGLSHFQRSGDVNVQLSPRDAVIFSRLSLGPLEFTLNASADPQKRDILASIEELEAELRFTERHGMMKFASLRLDQVYSQDVKVGFNKKFLRKVDKEDMSNFARERLYAKMAAQVSLEVVTLLRDKGLRDSLSEAADNAFSGFVVPFLEGM